jgi:hypothetical protein
MSTQRPAASYATFALSRRVASPALFLASSCNHCQHIISKPLRLRCDCKRKGPCDTPNALVAIGLLRASWHCAVYVLASKLQIGQDSNT